MESDINFRPRSSTATSWSPSQGGPHLRSQPILAWLVGCLALAEVTLGEPIGAVDVHVASRCLKAVRQISTGQQCVVEVDDVSTADITEWTEISNLHEYRALRVTAERHPRLEEDVGTRLACQSRFILRIPHLAECRLQPRLVVRSEKDNYCCRVDESSVEYFAYVRGRLPGGFDRLSPLDRFKLHSAKKPKHRFAASFVSAMYDEDLLAILPWNCWLLRLWPFRSAFPSRTLRCAPWGGLWSCWRGRVTRGSTSCTDSGEHFGRQESPRDAHLRFEGQRHGRILAGY